MAFIFARKKGPVELVRSCKKHVDLLSAAAADDERLIKKSLEKISLNLSNMKFMLYGDAENEPKEADISRLIEELFASNLLLDLLLRMRELEFEARKDVARVYDFVLRQKKQQSLEYVKSHEEILRVLVEGYTDSEIALNCGSILREVVRHEELCELLLNSPLLDNFFDYVQLSTFDIASDAFATFKLLLTKHKQLAARFLDSHFDAFTARYNTLLQSSNYVTKRQSLKLLGELLLNRSNFSVMMRYINSADNLKILMNLLRGTTKAIQFEAFHVFKIFVANPKKSAPVVEILVRNKKKLIDFLTKFQKEKEDDQFNEEKNTLLNTLQQLPDPQQPDAEEEKKEE